MPTAQAMPNVTGHTVELKYFKLTGKYYSSGSYVTAKEQMYEVFDEVRSMLFAGELPGLVKGCTEFIVHVDVPTYEYTFPAIIMPPKLEIVARQQYYADR